MELSDKNKALIKKFQLQEINGHYIYNYVAKAQKQEENAEILKKIASDELAHYEIYKRYTKEDVKHSRFTLFIYKIITRVLGPTFTVKLLENNEISAQDAYRVMKELPEIAKIIEDEENHERKLIGLIKEEKLNYMGSVVLGLNDALVELTGALAGLTLALRDPALIALTGSVTGIAAAFSMASSEYLSTKSEDAGKGAIKASIYTGITYLFTVIILVLPFLLLRHAFNFYYSVVKDEKFSRRFTEMVLLSFGVALLSFGVGYVLRMFFGIEA